mmetsp:Transcript_87239/g.251610  ORF Transcript_87239/g.251610 Transcript_87239/m.251610 type:complete len:434 (-) Transcript_87239:56-1357(-)
MDVQRRSVLRVEDGLALLPRQVRQHAVLQHARGVDDPDEVRRVRLDEFVGGFLRADVALCLLHVHAEPRRHGLDPLPRGHIQVGDLHGPGEELHAEACGALLLGLGQQPLAHDEREGAVATGDRDDTGARDGELLVRGFVGSGRDLARHEAALVGDAHGVVAEAALPDDLRGDLRVDLGRLRGLPVHVDVLDVNLFHLLPSGVAHAEKARADDDAEPDALVDLRVLLEDAPREDDELFRALVVLGDGLVQEEEGLELPGVLVEDVGHAVRVRRVQATTEDDEVPTAAGRDQADDLLLVELIGVVDELFRADASVRRRVDDGLADALAVREDEDALFRWVGRVREQGRGLFGLHEVLVLPRHCEGHVYDLLDHLVQRIASPVLEGKLLLVPLDRVGHLDVAPMAPLQRLNGRRGDPLILCVGHPEPSRSLRPSA